jgi:hypothetical protein
VEASNESVKGSGIDTNRLREFLFPFPSGLSWEKIKPTTKGRQLKPTKGRELTAPKLAEALAKQTQFSQEEWDGFGIKDLRYDHFIQSRGAYFRPSCVRRFTRQSYIAGQVRRHGRRWRHFEETRICDVGMAIH